MRETPHDIQKIKTLRRYSDLGLVKHIAQDAEGFIGANDCYAVQFVGEMDQRDRIPRHWVDFRVLDHELWFRGVRYVGGDRPVYVRRVIEAWDEAESDSMPVFMADLCRDQIENPCESEFQQALKNHKTCWTRLLREIEARL